MKIALGLDHHGIAAATKLRERLTDAGHEVSILGQCDGDAWDYPDSAWTVSRAVSTGEVQRGILLCGTGTGMCMAANKVDGVRAALVESELTARLSRSHNNANVLCLSADLLGQPLMERIVDTWMTTEFEGGRHARRVEKMKQIEQGENPGAREIEAENPRRRQVDATR